MKSQNSSATCRRMSTTVEAILVHQIHIVVMRVVGGNGYRSRDTPTTPGKVKYHFVIAPALADGTVRTGIRSRFVECWKILSI